MYQQRIHYNSTPHYLVVLFSASILNTHQLGMLTRRSSLILQWFRTHDVIGTRIAMWHVLAHVDLQQPS
jgi:hypothetical protein